MGYVVGGVFAGATIFIGWAHGKALVDVVRHTCKKASRKKAG